VLRPGDIAPEIDAMTSAGARFRLSEQRRKLCTILYFFPKAFTPGCTIETKRFRDNYPEMLLAGATIAGISTDNHDTQCLFAQSLRTPFPMIGDDDKRISKAYGVLWPVVGRAMRVTFIVNPLRTIEAVLHHEINISQHRDEVLRVMDRMRKRKPSALGAPPPVSASQREGLAKEPYELLSEAGVGAMGSVYRAREQATGRIVAVKLLSGAGDMARFAVEIDVLSKLSHPNIVGYVAHGATEDGRTYLVMEWLDGETLATKLSAQTNGEKLDLRTSIDIAQKIATGLAAAHEKGVVHRDIKPSNVLLTRDGAVKILDFGIARSTASTTTKLTRSGQLVGTPGYISPEQVRGVRTIDARADLFALGCVLFRCIMGRPPFEGDDALQLLHAVVHAPTPKLASAPAALDLLVTELLEKDPAKRPPSAESVATRLAVILKDVSANDRTWVSKPA
jgi:serine/threonine-protein kinase